jgi:hypothetical protein
MADNVETLSKGVSSKHQWTDTENLQILLLKADGKRTAEIASIMNTRFSPADSYIFRENGIRAQISGLRKRLGIKAPGNEESDSRVAEAEKPPNKTPRKNDKAKEKSANKSRSSKNAKGGDSNMAGPKDNTTAQDSKPLRKKIADNNTANVGSTTSGGPTEEEEESLAAHVFVKEEEQEKPFEREEDYDYYNDY